MKGTIQISELKHIIKPKKWIKGLKGGLRPLLIQDFKRRPNDINQNNKFSVLETALLMNKKM